MGFRFSRRIRIIPGVRLNLSRSGVSASFGGRGAWYTFGNGRRRATVGLPGTGLSYTTTTRTHADQPAEGSAPPTADLVSAGRDVLWLLLIVAVVLYALARAFSG